MDGIIGTGGGGGKKVELRASDLLELALAWKVLPSSLKILRGGILPLK